MRVLLVEDHSPLAEAVCDALLQAPASAIAAESWKWIEVATDLSYGFSHGLRRLAGDAP